MYLARKRQMEFHNDFTRMTGTRYPLVMAPMFLVSNPEMIRAAMRAGILGCFPSLNHREPDQLGAVLRDLNAYRATHLGGNYGVNLIVQQSNPLYGQHLKICADNQVPVYITSLGNPAATIEAAHSYGAVVFCDVTNLTHAEKCYHAGCDGFVAVGQGAGGHAGPFPTQLLVASLRKRFPDRPVLAAGGIADGRGILSALAGGAAAAYCGTRFIASSESTVSNEYIQAILDAGMGDIVMTDRISGTPCTIINTPFAQRIGLHQNRLQRFLGKNPKTRKYYKMLIQRRGFKWLEKATQPGNYNNLWCAGQSVEMIDRVDSVEAIVQSMITEMETAYRQLENTFRKPNG